MASDRSTRSLAALTGASTSRVLNLAAIAMANADNPEHASAPFFSTPAMNSAILLKHRVRSDETYSFADTRQVATKIIVPFDNKDLRAGGRSFFVDQRGYHDALRNIGNYGNREMERDLNVLRVVGALPSLDPFLLREQLRGHAIECADCYFAISPADQQRMHDYVSAEIRKLIQLATGGDAEGQSSAARLAAALLSTLVDEKLEPLRRTLMMNPADFREGVFSWRGFLYYKWTMEKFWPEVVDALRAIRAMRPTGKVTGEQRSFLDATQRAIIEKVQSSGQAVRRILGVYDAAYDDLVRNQLPATFRDFLRNAPHLFVDLGEKVGVMSHIASFWSYRFPKGANATVDADELTGIFQDFSSGFSASVPGVHG
ncbi:MAG TPA: hypothetical protein VNU97_15950 [Rhizomicrobium sp.]|nr:hypothetical protein [Rhizomicrobium sp.]